MYESQLESWKYLYIYNIFESALICGISNEFLPNNTNRLFILKSILILTKAKFILKYKFKMFTPCIIISTSLIFGVNALQPVGSEKKPLDHCGQSFRQIIFANKNQSWRNDF